MTLYILERLIFALAIPLAVIVLIVWWFVRRRNRVGGKSLAFSREDLTSQCLFVISLLFLGTTLFSFNRSWGDPISWQAVILITGLVGLAAAYYLKLLYSLIVSWFGLFIWWIVQVFVWSEGKKLNSSWFWGMFFFFGLVNYLIGRVHQNQRWKRFAMVYTVFGLIIISFLLFLFSSRIGFELFEPIKDSKILFASWQLASSWLALIAATAVLLFYSFYKKQLRAWELIGWLSFAVFFGILTFVSLPVLLQYSQSYGYGGSLTEAGVTWMVVFNVLAFLQLLGIIFAGYARQETWTINFGAFLLFVFIAVKYFDWFFTFLDKSVFFLVAGVLLFLVGWFMEKGRRYMVSTVEHKI